MTTPRWPALSLSDDSAVRLNQRVALVVAYDGSAFAGFARNNDVRTVAGDLEAHLSRVLRHPVVVTGAGRTDKGVHAWGQVVTFDTFADRLQPARLMRSINTMGAPSLAVRSIEAVSSDFDARFSATWRRYRYTILTTTAPNPFMSTTAWHLPLVLDVEAMRTASASLVGCHGRRRPPPCATGRGDSSTQ